MKKRLIGNSCTESKYLQILSYFLNRFIHMFISIFIYKFHRFFCWCIRWTVDRDIYRLISLNSFQTRNITTLTIIYRMKTIVRKSVGKNILFNCYHSGMFHFHFFHKNRRQRSQKIQLFFSGQTDFIGNKCYFIGYYPLY